MGGHPKSNCLSPYKGSPPLILIQLLGTSPHTPPMMPSMPKRRTNNTLCLNSVGYHSELPGAIKCYPTLLLFHQLCYIIFFGVHTNYNEYNIYVTLVTFWTTLFMYKWTNVVMDEFIWWPKPYLLLSATRGEISSWMIEIWMTIHLVSDNTYKLRIMNKLQWKTNNVELTFSVVDSVPRSTIVLSKTIRIGDTEPVIGEIFGHNRLRS